MNEIGDDIGQLEDYTFKSGLLGIGWAIEWLAQQKYLKIDTNEVLADLDDEVYKLVMFSETKDISLSNGTLGRMLYLYKRVTTKNGANDFYRETSLYEVLILTLNELYNVLNKDYFHSRMIEHNESMRFTICQVQRMLIKLKPLRLSSIVDELLNKINFVLKEFLTDLESTHDITPYNLNIYAYHQNEIALNNKASLKHIETFIANKNLKINFLNDDAVNIHQGKNFIFNKLCQLSKSINDYSWQEGWLIK